MVKTKKIALITGANKGLGFEMARQLAQAGIKVILTARDKQKGEEATSTLLNDGLDVHFLQLDVTNTTQIENVNKYLSTTYGKLDILINNAGMIEGENWGGNSVETIAIDQVRNTFDVNFFGLVALTQTLLPLIKKSEAGKIVNMSSILGSLTLHADQRSPVYNSKPFAYNVTKTALNQFTVHLAHSLRGTKVKVNSAHPGWVKTDLGTKYAPMDVTEGAKTGVALALLPDDGPTGSYQHLGKILPW